MARITVIIICWVRIVKACIMHRHIQMTGLLPHKENTAQHTHTQKEKGPVSSVQSAETPRLTQWLRSETSDAKRIFAQVKTHYTYGQGKGKVRHESLEGE